MFVDREVASHCPGATPGNVGRHLKENPYVSSALENAITVPLSKNLIRGHNGADFTGINEIHSPSIRVNFLDTCALFEHDSPVIEPADDAE
jgi:hypothetical protein